MKVCRKCNINKEISCFDKNKNMSDGHINSCKSCVSKYGKRNYIENRSRILEGVREYSFQNKDRINIKAKEYRNKNREKIRDKQNLKYTETRKSKRIKKTKKEKIEYHRLWQINRRKTDNVFKLNKNIRNLIQNSFKSINYKKTSKTVEILGCSIEEFKKYIEEKFEYWMNWKNHGKYNGNFNYGWDLDHIIPTSSAKTEDEILKLNYYTNFQPLCSKVNRFEKRNKLERVV